MTKKVLVFLCMLVSLVIASSVGTVAFCADNSVEGEIYDAYIEGNSAFVYVDFGKLESDAIMYAAIYSDIGKMTAVERIAVSKGQESECVQLSCEDISMGDMVKVFFFDKQTGVKPIGKSTYWYLENITLGAIVKDISITDSSLMADEVRLTIVESCENNEWNDKEGTDVVLKVDKIVDIKEYLGAKVNMNVWGVGEEYIVTDMAVADSENTLAFSSSDLDAGTTDMEICYYESDESARSTRIRLSSDRKIYYNFEEVDSIVDYLKYGDEFDGDAWITLYDNDENGRYETVVINRYSYDVVYESDYDRLSLYYNEIWYEEYNEEYTIMRCCGDETFPEDVSPGDVVQYISGWCGDNRWIIISVYEQNFAVGTVDAINNARQTVNIDGTSYKLYCHADIPSIGEYGRFYLTDRGEVFYYEWEAKTCYGYVIASEYSVEFGESCWKLKILTPDGNIYENRVSYRFKIDGERFYADDEDVSYLNNFVDEYNDSANEGIISFKEGDDGYISVINFPQTFAFDAKEYNLDNVTLAEISLSDVAVYDLTCKFRDEIRVSDMTCLSDGEEYSGIFASNMNGAYKYVFITSGDVSTEFEDDEESRDVQYGYVTAFGYKSASFEPAWQLKLLTEDGEEVYDFAEYFVVGDREYSGYDEYCEYIERISNSDSAEDRVLGIKLNSRDEIAELVIPEIYIFSEIEYDEANNVLYRELKENTVIYDATNGDHSEVNVETVSILSDGESYDGFVVKINNEYPIVIITEGVLSGETGDDEPAENDMCYGYMVASYFGDQGFDNAWMVRMLTTSGNTVDYVMADKFCVDGITYKADSYDNEYLDWNQDIYGYNYLDRIVSYSVNSSGKIDAINTSDCIEFEEEAFDSETNSIASYTIKDNSVVFEISESSGKTYTEKEFCDIYKYNGFIVQNDNMEYDCVVITEKTIASLSESFAVVNSYQQTTHSDGSDAILLFCYGADGEIHEITFVYDEEISKSNSGINADDIKRGSIIAYADDGDGVAEYMDILFSPDTEAEIACYWAYPDEVVGASEKCPGTYYMFGYVEGVTVNGTGYELEVYGDKFDVFGQSEIQTDLFIESTGNNYFLNNRRLETDSWNYYEDIFKTPADDYKFFVAKLVDNAVTDFVLYYR